MNAVHGLIFDFDTFHVLAADIQDTVHVRVKESGGIVMCHSLYLAVIQQKGRFHQCFPVTGRAGADDVNAFRKQAVDFLEGADSGLKGTAVVAAVERVKQGTIVAYQSHFRGGGTGIDAQKTVSLISGQVTGGNMVGVMSFTESFIFFL